MTDPERLLDELRPASFAIAHRMLGSGSEAQDVVQEALLRVHQALQAGEQIASPRALVAIVTTRLAIKQLRSTRVRRERYVGEWLPEPIITDGEIGEQLGVTPEAARRLVKRAVDTVRPRRCCTHVTDPSAPTSERRST